MICLQCLQLEFDKCVKISENNPVAPVNCYEKECELDIDDEDEYLKVLAFVAIQSFVALVSEDSVYILKVEEKGKAEKEEQDDYGHTIPPGQLYLRGKCLKKERSRSARHHKFSILSGNTICTPDEIFDVFVDISDALTIEKERFSTLLSRACAL